MATSVGFGEAAAHIAVAVTVVVVFFVGVFVVNIVAVIDLVVAAFYCRC